MPHQLVNVGESGVWHGPRSAEGHGADHPRAASNVGGRCRTSAIGFLNLITEAGGGLEHRSSTLLMTSRWATSSRPRYLRWLGLVSHELFSCLETGKRLRPIELGPFDYEAEVHTESLWVVEGLTTYYADLAVHRAGLSTEAEYLEALSPPDPGAADDAGTGGAAGGAGVLRRVDQVLPPRRELAEHLGQLLHQGGGGRLPARHADTRGDRRGRDARRRHAARLRAVLRSPRVHAERVQGHRGSGLPAKLSRAGSRTPSTRPASSTTRRPSTGWD